MSASIKTGAVEAFLEALKTGDLTALEIAAKTGLSHHDIRSAGTRATKAVKKAGDLRRAHILTWRLGPPMGVHGQRYLVAVYRLGHGENARQPESSYVSGSPGDEDELFFAARSPEKIDPVRLSAGSSVFRWADQIARGDQHEY